MKLLQNYPFVGTFFFGEGNPPHIGIDGVGFNGSYNVLDWIIAPEDGKIIEVVSSKNYTNNNPTNYGDYGNKILIDHGNGIKTRYAHLAYGTIKVAVGQTVNKGQVLAYMGATGYTFGGHLHFEVIINGNMVNPYDYIFNGKQLIKKITPIVARDVNVDQLEIFNPTVNIRVNAGINCESLGFAPKGIYNYYESKSANGYTWYKIADGQWVAADPSWLTLYPKKVEEPPHEELPPIDDNSEDNHSGDDTGGGNVPSIDNEPRSPVKIKISDIIIKFIEKLIKIFFKGGK